MTNETSTWSDETIPYICWDRDWSVAEIRSRLLSSEGVEKHRLMAWLMRELKTPEVWFFLKPTDIRQEFAGPRVGTRAQSGFAARCRATRPGWSTACVNSVLAYCLSHDTVRT